MEITAVALQTVNPNQNILFTDVAVPGCASIIYRSGSGQVTLRGLTSQCRARFRVTFSGNIGLPSTGTAAPITTAIAINGEPIASSEMISTPAAVSEFNNVASAVYLDVPAGCCLTASVKNTGTAAIDIQNANLIIERVA